VIRFVRPNPGEPDVFATVAPGHTIRKERVPAQRRSESGYAIFTCTCGWSDRTGTGARNALAEWHAKEVARD
jgi:hypothetical protein